VAPSYNVTDKKLNKEITPETECNVIKLKCSGVMEAVSLKAVPTDQTRHLGPPLRTISCLDTMLSLQDSVRGDPGSVFVFNCPQDCANGGVLTGAGL